MTKKFIREEWYNPFVSAFDLNLLDLFQSFEDRIEELQIENKSLRDDVNYLRGKILPLRAEKLKPESNIEKEEKPKRKFEILFASDNEILVKEQRGLDESDVYYAYDIYTQINIEERKKEIEKRTNIYTAEQFEEALKEFKKAFDHLKDEKALEIEDLSEEKFIYG